MTTLIITTNDSNQTLLTYLKKVFKTLPLARIYRLVRSKKIRINNKVVTNFKYLLQPNDIIIIYESNLTISYQPQSKIKQAAPINVFYEDDNLLIVNKEHNIIVHHPYSDNLDNMVKYYLQTQNRQYLAEKTFVISHLYRLDKLTAGLLIYPKNKITQTQLYQAKNDSHITKKYLAVCHGTLAAQKTVSGYITHDEANKKMIFSNKTLSTNSKNCTTILTPLFTSNNYTLIECQLITGRKHQIRSTLEFLHLPIVGDKKYGSNVIITDKILLFAYYLAFNDLKAPLTYLNGQEFILSDLKSYLINQIKKEKW